MNQFLIDNILLLVIILVCVVTLAAPYVNRRRFSEVDNASATNLINHKGAQIIDLRDPAEFKKECIARSVNIPADQAGSARRRRRQTRPHGLAPAARHGLQRGLRAAGRPERVAPLGHPVPPLIGPNSIHL